MIPVTVTLIRGMRETWTGTMGGQEGARAFVGSMGEVMLEQRHEDEYGRVDKAIKTGHNKIKHTDTNKIRSLRQSLGYKGELVREENEERGLRAWGLS